jgi:hypothetical protein
MKILLPAFILLCTMQTGNGFEPTVSFDAQASHIALDASNNIYLIEDIKISMFDPAGELEYWYSNMYTKSIHSIDVSDPERILLFYKQDQKITLINQHFRSIPEPFFLNEKGYRNISQACLSDDSNIWIFNKNKQALTKITDQGDFIIQNENVSSEISGKLNPAFMACYDGNIYLSDPGLGIFVFDPIGQYLETIPVKGAANFRIANGNLLFTQNDHAIIYELNSGRQTTFEMPVKKFKTAAVDIEGKNLMLYVADLNQVKVFKSAFVNK